VKTVISSFFNTLISKFMLVWNKLRLAFSPTWWRVTGIAAVTGFFRNIFSVKPRDKNDYYGMFRWLVSKKLAFAIIIGAAVLGIWYIIAMSPLASASGAGEGGPSIPTYRYNSLALKFHRGEVRILDKDNLVAYIGFVADGRAQGRGRLFAPGGEVMYGGEFQNSMYEGQGELFYPDGAFRYIGEFSKNQFHGAGSHFRPNGTLEYSGGYAFGLRSGQGELFNGSGSRIYTGTFHMDHLVYAELAGKTTAEVSGMYEGQATSYMVRGEYCVALHEIGAVYAVQSGEGTLDQEWRVSTVYVLSDTIYWNGAALTSISDLRSNLDQPEYAGYTWVTLADAVSLNLSPQEDIEPIPVRGRFVLEDVYEGTDYDGHRQIYIYAFRVNGLVYTFYTESTSSQGFVMYSIEQDLNVN
jgi:hypothetical protein